MKKIVIASSVDKTALYIVIYNAGKNTDRLWTKNILSAHIQKQVTA